MREIGEVGMCVYVCMRERERLNRNKVDST